MTARPDRRCATRLRPDESRWKPEAVLRPGLAVRLIDIGPRGALIESAARLRPGRRAELQLAAHGTEQRELVTGRVERCHVSRLNPLLFRGAIAFEGCLDCGSGA